MLLLHDGKNIAESGFGRGLNELKMKGIEMTERVEVVGWTLKMKGLVAGMD
jgi:hypothetical protein